MVFLLLIFMFFLGCVQVIWALVHGLTSSEKQVRKHFGFYGIGVVVYFLLMWLIVQLAHQDWETPIFGIHFFGGAFILAAYHVWIVVLAFRLRAAGEPSERWV